MSYLEVYRKHRDLGFDRRTSITITSVYLLLPVGRDLEFGAIRIDNLLTNIEGLVEDSEIHGLEFRDTQNSLKLSHETSAALFSKDMKKRYKNIESRIDVLRYGEPIF